MRQEYSVSRPRYMDLETLVGNNPGHIVEVESPRVFLDRVEVPGAGVYARLRLRMLIEQRVLIPSRARASPPSSTTLFCVEAGAENRCTRLPTATALKRGSHVSLRRRSLDPRAVRLRRCPRETSICVKEYPLTLLATLEDLGSSRQTTHAAAAECPYTLRRNVHAPREGAVGDTLARPGVCRIARGVRWRGLSRRSRTARRICIFPSASETRMLSQRRVRMLTSGAEETRRGTRYVSAEQDPLNCARESAVVRGLSSGSWGLSEKRNASADQGAAVSLKQCTDSLVSEIIVLFLELSLVLPSICVQEEFQPL
ncbi:hypothetical protein B0H11DRAFT_2280908 [Mycena galericulata]|nr:hypothetical protein B0H11DRAFT_2280908 [Mycena galericulata]